jgi:hypothetical protein
MIFATALAVVSNVGVFALAGESLPDGSGRDGSTVAFKIPQPVIDYLSRHDSPREKPLPHLFPVLDLDTGLLSEPIPGRINPRVIDQPDNVSSNTELSPVPLPAPVWSGAAGLLGLGAIRLFNRLRQGLR